MKYDINRIKQTLRQNPGTEILYFGGHKLDAEKTTPACLSNWYACCFEVDGVRFHTTEQYMMAIKTLLFGDDEVNREIMAAYHTHDYKKQGRKAHGFFP